jgi:ATP-dependent Lon protease
MSEQKIHSRGILLLTGKQGDVMKESMNVALTCALNNCDTHILEKYDFHDIFENLKKTDNNDDNNDDSIINQQNIVNNDDNKSESNLKNNKQKFSLHIHCPDGSTPKDGPSAGCAITIGILSILQKKHINNKYSMTGEIDILGNILPIGGLSSKIMGSKNSGIKNIIVPQKNEKDIKKIETKNAGILKDVNIFFVNHIKDVISLVF